MEPVAEQNMATVWYGGSPSARDGAIPTPMVTSPWSVVTGQPHISLSNGVSLPPQAVLAGRYRMEQVLGRGALAVVHSAWDLMLHRWVAVKVYDSQSAGQVSTDEVRLQATCQHPNLMPLHDAGSDARLGVTFLVMPLYPGADLAATLARYGPMPFRTTLLCVDQVCSALEFFWQQRQALHGDIKPANIWLTQSGAALLMDFNLQGLLVRGACMRAGTPGFTAPEALKGQRDQRSDVFSLGCVLYQCLAGVSPFTDDAAVCAGRYTPLRELRPDIRPELEAIVDTALEPGPDRRFQNAREMRTALRSPARMMGLARRGFDWSKMVRLVGKLAGTTLTTSSHLTWKLMVRLTQGAWHIIECSAVGVGWIVGGFCRQLFRQPLQAAVEALVLWIFGHWAYYAGLAWVRVHPATTAAIAVLVLLVAGASGSGRPRRRSHPETWRMLQ